MHLRHHSGLGTCRRPCSPDVVADPPIRRSVDRLIRSHA